MSIETMFFDLDDTLYPRSLGVWDAIGARMELYMVERISIPADLAPSERKRLFQTHGTTLRGLIAEYQIDDLDFLDYVHDIPIDELLSEAPPLEETLALYPYRKVIFTNAHTGHAKRVLETLKIADFFDQIIDIRAIMPWCKPQPEAFSIALELAGIKDATQCLLIDDAYRNLVTAHDLGLGTIQVGADQAAYPVDAAILSLSNLPAVLDANGSFKGNGHRNQDSING